MDNKNTKYSRVLTSSAATFLAYDALQQRQSQERAVAQKRAPKAKNHTSIFTSPQSNGFALRRRARSRSLNEEDLARIQGVNDQGEAGAGMQVPRRARSNSEGSLELTFPQTLAPLSELK